MMILLVTLQVATASAFYLRTTLHFDLGNGNFHKIERDVKCSLSIRLDKGCPFCVVRVLQVDRYSAPWPGSGWILVVLPGNLCEHMKDRKKIKIEDAPNLRWVDSKQKPKVLQFIDLKSGLDQGKIFSPESQDIENLEFWAEKIKNSPKYEIEEEEVIYRYSTYNQNENKNENKKNKFYNLIHANVALVESEILKKLFEKEFENGLKVEDLSLFVNQQSSRQKINRFVLRNLYSKEAKSKHSKSLIGERSLISAPLVPNSNGYWELNKKYFGLNLAYKFGDLNQDIKELKIRYCNSEFLLQNKINYIYCFQEKKLLVWYGFKNMKFYVPDTEEGAEK